MSTTLTNIAKETYKIGNANLSTSAQSTFELFANVLNFEKTQFPTSGVSGDTVVFTLEMKTPVAITNLFIVDDLASVGYTFITGSVEINGVSNPTADPTVGISIGPLAANVILKIEFSATVN